MANLALILARSPDDSEGAPDEKKKRKNLILMFLHFKETISRFSA